jgi:metal transporter CNNM
MEETIEWWRILLIVLLGVLAGVFSGLNLGIIGLDPGYLELLTMGPFETKEDERDATYARRILPLRRRGNLLLCTILLGNVAVQSLFSILLADLTSGIVGVLVSTFVIMVFGEILPQAVCSRYALVIGAYTMWILYFFCFVTFPISFPLSAILDKMLGEDVGNVYNKNKMKKMF